MAVDVRVNGVWKYTAEYFPSDGMLWKIITPEGSAALDPDDFEESAELVAGVFGPVASLHLGVVGPIWDEIVEWLTPIIECAGDCGNQVPQPGGGCPPTGVNPPPGNLYDCCVYYATVVYCMRICGCQQQHGGNHIALGACAAAAWVRYNEQVHACMMEHLMPAILPV